MNADQGPVRVTLQIATAFQGLPDEDDFTCWANRALASSGIPLTARSCVTIRIVDEQESQALNSSFRNVPKPTNVLAFPAGPVNPAIVDDDEELGDLVICAAVVAEEACDQQKNIAAHFAHMTVHGCLHLAGYDHIDNTQAAAMEALEEQIMASLGFPNPYGQNNER